MDFGNPSEKSSDYVKRVLFGGACTTPAKTPVTDITRSESQSSSSSAPGSAIYGIPNTPQNASAGAGALGRSTLTAKTPTSNNAAVSVFLRVRPPGSPGADVDKLTGRRTYQILQDQATLRTFPPLSAGHSRTINRQAKDFGFTRVFNSKASQRETYESTMRPLVDDMFACRNALLFAYGMTNAGKTFTVLGEEGFPGLIPQALTDTFERVASIDRSSAVETTDRVEMSFLEIYNENVYDLLAATSADDWANARTALKLDDRMGVIQARDLSKHVICSASDGLDLVKKATANRMVASTKLNEDSSRSHSVCMIKLVREKAKDSNLWVVDLAGSERSVRSGVGASSTRQKEANSINKSLSTLWHCLTIMRSNVRKDEPETRVPFRESKLTHLFKNHLQGPAAGKTVMVVNVNPSVEDFDETQQVLKNSTIARDVKTVKDASAANRQNGLINTHYGFNGRKMHVKKPAASRRSIHQAVAPKLENLGPPPPRKKIAQSTVRVEGCSHGGGDTDSASAVGDDQQQRDDGYLSGAESDSGLVDTRQSINLAVKHLQVDNEVLKSRLKATLEVKEKDMHEGHQPIPGGPVERYIALLENKIGAAEEQIEEMRQEHLLEVEELEAEFESFIADNNFVGVKNDDTLTARLQEEARVANLQADQWKKEAETLRTRLEGIETRMSPTAGMANGGGVLLCCGGRSPLRKSLGSTGRPSSENRQDGENSPPLAKKAGLAPGGVGSPSKNAHRNMSNSQKIKASALPSKKALNVPLAVSKVSIDDVAGSSIEKEAVVTSDAAVAMSTAAVTVCESTTPNGNDVETVETPDAVFDGVGGGTGKQGKVVIALSRRVSVLRVSNAGVGRVSNARPSLAGGARRKSRASHATAAGRRVSQLRSRPSNGLPPTNHAARAPSGGLASESAGVIKLAHKNGVHESADPLCCVSGRVSNNGSRRESAMLLEEDNFLEKARRCMLRAIGISSRKSVLAAESSSGGSFRVGRTVPETAEEIEAHQKIKVKMPRRPNKKAMEGAPGSTDLLWTDEQQSDEVVEEEGPSPRKDQSSSNVINGIERWVFGSKPERVTPKAKRVQGAASDVSPAPSQGSATKTIHDYVRAM